MYVQRLSIGGVQWPVDTGLADLEHSWQIKDAASPHPQLLQPALLLLSVNVRHTKTTDGTKRKNTTVVCCTTKT